MDNYTVYMHRFPNGKVYIGITRVAPEKRWRNGKGYSENRFMQFAINKYGWENVEHFILFSGLTKEEAEEKEIQLIAEYNSTNPNFGYNIENGGNAIGKTSEIARKHIGEAVLKYHKDHPEYRKRLSDAHKGKKLTEEQKKKNRRRSQREKEKRTSKEKYVRRSKESKKRAPGNVEQSSRKKKETSNSNKRRWSGNKNLAFCTRC